MHTDFTPLIWTEDMPPIDANSYKQCEICSEKSRFIWGEGNPNAPVIIILDNPGAREDKEGKEYVCGTRQTLQTALHSCGLPARSVYLTYLLKCRPTHKYNKEKIRAFSKPFLFSQIQDMHPEFIVCLGDVVVQAVFDNQYASVKSLRGQWHTILNYPCMVSYHPLAVRRRPNLMPLFLEDWKQLARALHKFEKTYNE